MFFEIAQVSPYIWATLEGGYFTKNLKNHQIWSHTAHDLPLRQVLLMY